MQVPSGVIRRKSSDYSRLTSLNQTPPRSNAAVTSREKDLIRKQEQQSLKPNFGLWTQRHEQVIPSTQFSVVKANFNQKSPMIRNEGRARFNLSTRLKPIDNNLRFPLSSETSRIPSQNENEDFEFVSFPETAPPLFTSKPNDDLQKSDSSPFNPAQQKNNSIEHLITKAEPELEHSNSNRNKFRLKSPSQKARADSLRNVEQLPARKENASQTQSLEKPKERFSLNRRLTEGNTEQKVLKENQVDPFKARNDLPEKKRSLSNKFKLRNKSVKANEAPFDSPKSKAMLKKGDSAIFNLFGSEPWSSNNELPKPENKNPDSEKLNNPSSSNELKPIPSQPRFKEDSYLKNVDSIKELTFQAKQSNNMNIIKKEFSNENCSDQDSGNALDNILDNNYNIKIENKIDKKDLSSSESNSDQDEIIEDKLKQPKHSIFFGNSSNGNTFLRSNSVHNVENEKSPSIKTQTFLIQKEEKMMETYPSSKGPANDNLLWNRIMNKEDEFKRTNSIRRNQFDFWILDTLRNKPFMVLYRGGRKIGIRFVSVLASAKFKMRKMLWISIFFTRLKRSVEFGLMSRKLMCEKFYKEESDSKVEEMVTQIHGKLSTYLWNFFQRQKYRDVLTDLEVGRENQHNAAPYFSVIITIVDKFVELIRDLDARNPIFLFICDIIRLP